jgi:hypothetical protein
MTSLDFCRRNSFVAQLCVKVPENGFSFTPGFSPVMEARGNWGNRFNGFHAKLAVKVVENAEVAVIGPM